MKYNNFIEILKYKTEQLNNGIGNLTTILPLDDRSRNNIDRYCEKEDINDLQEIVAGLTDVDSEVDALIEYDSIKTVLVYKDKKNHKILMSINKIDYGLGIEKNVCVDINPDNSSNLGYNYKIYDNDGEITYELKAVKFTYDMISIVRNVSDSKNSSSIIITTPNDTKYHINYVTKNEYDFSKISKEEENFYANLQNLKFDIGFTNICYLMKLSAPTLFNSIDLLDIKILNNNNTSLGEAIYKPNYSIDKPLKFIKQRYK